MSAESTGENALLFKALSHPTRLRIVALIREQRPCVKSMEELLGVSQPNLSQHLSLLRHAGVVESERDGNQVCYRIKNERVLKLLDALSH
ncbi:MAG: metalloregulator ArsR/SmtB family transcription factor [bacterium]|nr:metalloregulator ArsR/SmtB family transcription factor [bacterium]